MLVLNPSGFARTDVVSVLLPESREVAVVDAETQERVPHAVGPPEPSRNRPRGRPLSFVATNVPPLGYRRFDLVADDAAQEAGGGALENEHYRLEIDVASGCATSVVDKELGVELVDAASSFGLGQVVHDRYGSALDATARLAAGQRADHGIDGRRRARRSSCPARSRRRASSSTASRTRSRSA